MPHRKKRFKKCDSIYSLHKRLINICQVILLFHRNSEKELRVSNKVGPFFIQLYFHPYSLRLSTVLPRHVFKSGHKWSLIKTEADDLKTKYVHERRRGLRTSSELNKPICARVVFSLGYTMSAFVNSALAILVSHSMYETPVWRRSVEMTRVR